MWDLDALLQSLPPADVKRDFMQAAAPQAPAPAPAPRPFLEADLAAYFAPAPPAAASPSAASSQEVKALQAKLSALQVAEAQHRLDIQDLHDTIAKLQADLAKTEGQKTADLRHKLASLQISEAQLKTKIATLEQNIVSLESKIAYRDNQILLMQKKAVDAETKRQHDLHEYQVKVDAHIAQLKAFYAQTAGTPTPGAPPPPIEPPAAEEAGPATPPPPIETPMGEEEAGPAAPDVSAPLPPIAPTGSVGSTVGKVAGALLQGGKALFGVFGGGGSKTPAEQTQETSPEAGIKQEPEADVAQPPPGTPPADAAGGPTPEGPPPSGDATMTITDPKERAKITATIKALVQRMQPLAEKMHNSPGVDYPEWKRMAVELMTLYHENRLWAHEQLYLVLSIFNNTNRTLTKKGDAMEFLTPFAADATEGEFLLKLVEHMLMWIISFFCEARPPVDMGTPTTSLFDAVWMFFDAVFCFKPASFHVKMGVDIAFCGLTFGFNAPISPVSKRITEDKGTEADSDNVSYIWGGAVKALTSGTYHPIFAQALFTILSFYSSTVGLDGDVELGDDRKEALRRIYYQLLQLQLYYLATITPKDAIEHLASDALNYITIAGGDSRSNLTNVVLRNAIHTAGGVIFKRGWADEKSADHKYWRTIAIEGEELPDQIESIISTDEKLTKIKRYMAYYNASDKAVFNVWRLDNPARIVLLRMLDYVAERILKPALIQDAKTTDWSHVIALREQLSKDGRFIEFALRSLQSRTYSWGNSGDAKPIGDGINRRTTLIEMLLPGVPADDTTRRFASLYMDLSDKNKVAIGATKDYWPVLGTHFVAWPYLWLLERLVRYSAAEPLVAISTILKSYTIGKGKKQTTVPALKPEEYTNRMFERVIKAPRATNNRDGSATGMAQAEDRPASPPPPPPVVTPMFGDVYLPSTEPLVPLVIQDPVSQYESYLRTIKTSSVTDSLERAYTQATRWVKDHPAVIPAHRLIMISKEATVSLTGRKLTRNLNADVMKAFYDAVMTAAAQQQRSS